jgi:hypothetical protein
MAQHSGSGISSVRAYCQILLTMSGNAGAEASVGSELMYRHCVSNQSGCTLSLLSEAEARFTTYDLTEVRVRVLIYSRY